MDSHIAAMNSIEVLHWRAIAICILRRRRALGWSQAVLASRAGLSRSEIQHIERGRRCPRSGTLVRVCGAFGISYPELITEAERVKGELIAAAR